jgi:ABC-2 type transport system permease protein
VGDGDRAILGERSADGGRDRLDGLDQPTPSLACVAMSDLAYPIRTARATRGVAYYLRVLRVVGRIEFKAKYAGAALGYFWSLAKPLAYFGVLWLVFAHLLRTSNQTGNFTLFLLIGILLFTFFVDTVSTMLPSIVEGGAILRRLAFPPILIPLSASVGICITFAVNMLAVVVFIAIQRVSPRLEWLLVPPLLAELYVFCVGLGLFAAALFVRFRDVGQIWEVASQLLFFACAIFFPVGILPVWAQKVAFLNPVVQIIQDVRHAILGGASGPYDVTAATVYAGIGGRIIPILVVVVVFVGALAFFRREGRYFAERV